MRAIGGAAVVNRLARFCLDNCGAWIGAAAQPIAAKARSYRLREGLADAACNQIYTGSYAFSVSRNFQWLRLSKPISRFRRTSHSM